MTKERVNEIDLLRFCAAVLVVFFHYSFRGYAADGMSVMPYPLLSSYAKYGYLGVELFFMISGFVILMTAANGSLRSFIVSRIVRLYPAFWACCTITLVITLLIGAPRFTVTLKQYLINMTMLSEFLSVPSVDGSYWSLFVEMRFYALVSVILAIGRIHQAQLILILWLIASIILEVLSINKGRYLLIVEYSAYFIAGATYFMIWSQGITLTRIGMVILSWGLALFRSMGTIQGLQKNFNTDFNGYVVAGIITLFFIVMLLVSIRRTGFFGRSHWILAGSLTYPLYLLHQNIGFMIFNALYPKINAHILFWGTITIVMVAAFSVHILIERRYSKALKNSINRSIDRMQQLTRVFAEVRR